MKDRTYLVTLHKSGSGTSVLPEITSLEDLVRPLSNVGDEITIKLVPVTSIRLDES